MAAVIDPATLASFGPFFAVTTHPRVPDPPWRPMSELVSGPEALAARVAQVRAALGASAGTRTIELRVAASAAQLGLTARLVAPALGLAVLGVPDPTIDLAGAYWQAELGGPFPLSLPDCVGRSDGPRTGVDGGLGALLEGPVLALVDATLRAVPMSSHVLWGNVASAVHSAGQMVGTARPEFVARAADVVNDALAHPLLRTEHRRVDRRFQRRSCCLIYRIAGPGPIDPGRLCADCVLGRTDVTPTDRD